MPPKTKEVKKIGVVKTGMLAKDIVPQKIKQPPREGKPLKIPQDVAQIEKIVNYQPFPLPEVWPTDEEVKAFNFGIESNLNYSEKVTYNLPPSFSYTSSQITFWRRPKEYLQGHIEEDEDNQDDDVVVPQKRGLSHFGKAQAEQKLKVAGMAGQRRKSGTGMGEGSRSLKRLSTMSVEKAPSLQGKQKLTFLSRHSDDSDLLSQMSPASKRRFEKEAEDKEAMKLVVFRTHQRDETQKEFEARLKVIEQEKALQAKDKKKPAKPVKGQKEEAEEAPEGPIKVRDIKLTNISMAGYYPYYSKWIGSQLQVIKDRQIMDAHTNKPLWSKVYPQAADGIPVYNPSGRYWVKLYYMGSIRKIEIDDRFPTSVKKMCLFPRSEFKEELWPMIFTKALLKLQSFSSKYTQEQAHMIKEVGDGSVLYALTGYVPQTIQLDRITADEFKYINTCLNDSNYLNKNKFITCFCNPEHKPSAPSNQITSEKELFLENVISSNSMERKKSKKHMTQIGNSITPKTFDSGSKLQLDQSQESPPSHTSSKPNLQVDVGKTIKNIMREKPTYVIPGFAYALIESFFNERFNMMYTRERSAQEIQCRLEYYNMSLNSQITKMTRDQKLEFRKRKKELREKIKIEDKKRNEILKMQPVQYRFFRLYTNVSKVPLLQFIQPFTASEILIAQKCLLNKLIKPPNYDLAEIKGDDSKSMVSLTQTAQGALDQFIPKPLSEFQIPNFRDVTIRTQRGNWLQDVDLKAAFQFVQIFHNLQMCRFHQVLFVPSRLEYQLIKCDECEVLVVHQNLSNENQGQIQEQPYQQQDMFDNNVGFTEQGGSSSRSSSMCDLIVGFSPQMANNQLIMPHPYLVLQHYDFDRLQTRGNASYSIAANMDGINVSFDFADPKEHFDDDIENTNMKKIKAFKVQINSPLGFGAYFGSTHQFQPMSLMNYLQTYCHFKCKSFLIEYPQSIQKNTYYLYARYLIQPQIDEVNLMIRLRATEQDKSQLPSNPYLFQFLRFKLVKMAENSLENVMFNQIEGLHFNTHEQISMLVSQLSQFQLQENTAYVLLVEGLCGFHVPEGSFELELLYKSNNQQQQQLQDFQINLIEPVEPLYYMDAYQPNKYGQIFKERLFVGQGNIHATFFVQLNKDVQMDDKQETAEQQLKEKGQAMAKKGKTGKQEEVKEQETELLKEQRVIKLELFCDEKLICYSIGHNNAYLADVVLENNSNANYYLQLGFDLRQWPGAVNGNDESTQGINWQLSVFANETVAVVRDTQKEDRERELRMSWEINEPGRGERAKKSRLKFLLQRRLANGEELNEEEAALLNEPRISKKQREEEKQQALQNLTKGGVQKKAEAKKVAAPVKGGKGVKVEEVQVEGKKVVQFPKSSSHNMTEIHELLMHLEQPRLLEQQFQQQQQAEYVRTEEQLHELRETLKMAKEDNDGKLMRSTELRQTLKLYQKEQRDELMHNISQTRKDYLTQIAQVMAEREKIKQGFLAKQARQKALIDLLLSENPSKEAIMQGINAAEGGTEQQVNPELIDVARKVLVNARIAEIKERLDNGVTNFDLQLIEQAMNEIEKFKVEVPQEMLDKAKEIQLEAQEDPDYIENKLKELKKTGKKPGKK